jgi:hypothetical protein
MTHNPKQIVIVNSKGYFLKYKYPYQRRLKRNIFNEGKQDTRYFNDLESAQFFLEVNVTEPNCRVVYLDQESKVQEVGHKIENPYKLVK